MTRLTRYFEPPPEVVETVTRESFETALEDDAVPEFPECPSLELYEHLLLPAISTEDRKDRIRAMFAKLLVWLKRVREWFNNAMDPIHSTLMGLKFQAGQFRIRMNSEASKSQSGTFEMESHALALSVRYRPVASVQELMTSLYLQKSYITGYYDYIHKTLLPGIRSLMTDMGNARDGALLSPVQLQKIHGFSPLKLKDSLKLQPVSGNAQRLVTGHLPGNYRLELTRPGDETTLAGLEGIRFAMRHSENNPKPVARKWSVHHFNFLSTEQCLTQIEDTLDLLSDYFEVSAKQAVNTVIKQVEDTIKRIERRDLDDTQLTATVALLRRMITWVSDPYQGLATRAISTLRGSLVLCSRNRI